MKQPNLKGTYQLESSVDIKGSQAKVWQVLSDFANVYTWAPGVEKSHALGSIEKNIGAGRYCKLADFGEIEEFVTLWQEGTGFIYDVTPLGPLCEAYSCWWLDETAEKHTKLTVKFSYNIRFGLFGKLMHKLVMRKKLEDSLPEALNALKRRVETGQLVRPLVTTTAAA